MEKQFVTYEIAKKLKELGFDEPCIKMILIGGSVGFVNKESDILSKPITNTQGGKYTITYPLWQQAIDWLRENHDIIVEVWFDESQDDGFDWMYEIYVNKKAHEHDGSYYGTFYNCREAGILKAIKLS